MSDKDDKTVIAEAGYFSILTGSKDRKQACLVQYSGTGLGKRYILEKEEVLVGRSPDADIYIGDSSVSRSHARFNLSGDYVAIKDLGSANGTFLNDQRVLASTNLKDGDIVRLGTILLKFFDSGNIDGIIQDKIYRMATVDAGTQVFNKQYLQDALATEFKFSKIYGRDLSIIYYDLDHFKIVNDTFGHNAGDMILKDSSLIVKNTIRKDDIQARFGGEEFIIILPNTDAKIAFDLADRIRQSVARHVFKIEVDTGGHKKIVEHCQTISVGVAQLTPSMKTPEELLETADKKLYTSKQTGRNRVTV
jgi:diguanylate cyclase (GGDEF)-like protein